MPSEQELINGTTLHYRFCKAKENANSTKWQIIDWEKIFTNSTSDRGLIHKTDKELKKIHTTKPNNPIKNGVRS